MLMVSKDNEKQKVMDESVDSIRENYKYLSDQGLFADKVRYS